MSKLFSDRSNNRSRKIRNVQNVHFFCQGNSLILFCETLDVYKYSIKSNGQSALCNFFIIFMRNRSAATYFKAVIEYFRKIFQNYIEIASAESAQTYHAYEIYEYLNKYKSDIKNLRLRKSFTQILATRTVIKSDVAAMYHSR